jgi:hypothetical protein
MTGLPRLCAPRSARERRLRGLGWKEAQRNWQQVLAHRSPLCTRVRLAVASLIDPPSHLCTRVCLAVASLIDPPLLSAPVYALPWRH